MGCALQPHATNGKEVVAAAGRGGAGGRSHLQILGGLPLTRASASARPLGPSGRGEALFSQGPPRPPARVRGAVSSRNGERDEAAWPATFPGFGMGFRLAAQDSPSSHRQQYPHSPRRQSVEVPTLF